MNEDEKYVVRVQIQLVILYVLFSLFVLIIFPSMNVFSAEKGSDLIVIERDGWVIINTNPELPMALNPYEQPRLSIDMRWRIKENEDTRIKLTFLYMGKRGMCPEAFILRYRYRFQIQEYNFMKIFFQSSILASQCCVFSTVGFITR